jgi:ribose transport system substrate-binding protein
MHPRLLLVPLLSLAAALLTACGPADAPSATPATDAARPAGQAITIAVIPKGTTHEFWRSIEAGARKAEQELNAAGTPVEVIWKGPLREDDRDQQVQVVENFTARKVAGLVLAPLDERALVAPVETAVAAGIPVVVMDSDLKSDRRVSFVATDNFLGGKIAGEHLAQLLNGRGNVILLRYAVGSASTTAREEGFLAALKAFPEIRLLSSDQYAGATRETAYQASQNLLNRFGREVQGVFCPCEPAAIGMARALHDLGLAGGRVKMVGFDAGTQSVADLRAGNLQGLVVQNPVRMGYEAVKSLVTHLQGGRVEPRIDTGVALVTKENMDQPEIAELLNPPLERYLKR